MLQLREQDRHTLQATLARFPEVHGVWIFGSRAAGRARRASDIDLAIEAPSLAPARWYELIEALDQAPIIYRLDVIHLDILDDPGLEQAILRSRVPL